MKGPVYRGHTCVVHVVDDISCVVDLKRCQEVREVQFSGWQLCLGLHVILSDKHTQPTRQARASSWEEVGIPR